MADQTEHSNDGSQQALADHQANIDRVIQAAESGQGAFADSSNGAQQGQQRQQPQVSVDQQMVDHRNQVLEIARQGALGEDAGPQQSDPQSSDAQAGDAVHAEPADSQDLQEIPKPKTRDRGAVEEAIKNRLKRRKDQEHAEQLRQQYEQQLSQYQQQTADYQRREQMAQELIAQGKVDEALQLRGFQGSLNDLQRQQLEARGLLEKSRDPRVDAMQAELTQLRQEREQQRQHVLLQQQQQQEYATIQREQQLIAGEMANLNYKPAERMAKVPAMVQFAHNQLTTGQAETVEDATIQTYHHFQSVADLLNPVYSSNHLGDQSASDEANRDLDAVNREARPGAAGKQNSRTRSTNLSQRSAADVSDGGITPEKDPVAFTRAWQKRTLRRMQQAEVTAATAQRRRRNRSV